MVSTSSERARALEALAATIADLRLDLVEDAARAASTAGATRLDCVNEAVVPALRIVGTRFSEGTYFVPHLITASDTAKIALDALPGEPHGADASGWPCVVLGTVSGDVHDIGKNLVSELLSASGCKVVDLGVDQPPESFVEAVRFHEADIVGLSAMMTTTFPAMRRTVEMLKTASPGLPVVVGGAPVTQDFADSIGADGYGSLATDALGLVEQYCEATRSRR